MLEVINRPSQIQKLLQAHSFLGILFYSGHYAPSKALLPVLEAFVTEFPHIKFATCDLNSIRQSYLYLGVTKTPEFWICGQNKLLRKIVGVDPIVCFEALSTAMDLTHDSAEDLNNAADSLKESFKWCSKLVVAGHTEDEQYRKLVEFITQTNCLSYCWEMSIDDSNVELLDVIGANEEELPLVFIHPSELIQADAVLNSSDESSLERIKMANNANKEEIEKHMAKITGSAPVVAFIKGEKSNPFCRFSKALVRLFNEADIEFETVNILQNEILREKLKIVSNWPTYPQVYVKGELVGGLDILREMVTDCGGVESLRKTLLG